MRTQPRAPLYITCSRYRETPNHGEHQRSRKQRRCRCGPIVRPYERLCNTYRHNDSQRAAPTFRGCGDTYFRWLDSYNPCGTPATITAVHLPTAIRNVLPHEAMPNYNSHAGTYNLDVSPAMLTRQVLGCRGSEPPESHCHWRATCRKGNRSGQLGWPEGTCPEHSDCGGSDRSPRHRGGAGMALNKSGAKRFTD